VAGDDARPVLVAPDKFKGTYDARAVARAIGRGLERGGCAVDSCPVGDGGDGTLVALVEAMDGELRSARVRDPLGRPVEAAYGLLEGGATGLVEMATASGLALLAADELDPFGASTYGTGELILQAVADGARRVLVAVGGSATVDGGAGALEAIEAGGGLADTGVVVLCDVQTPWERAAEIYGPQKGATPDDVPKLAARMDELAARLPRDPRGVPATGAAGGLSGALWAAFGAELADGAAWVLDAVNFDARLAAARAVVTGEGRLDESTLEGKLVGAIAQRARAAGLPVFAVVGQSTLTEALGLEQILEATDEPAMERAGEAIARAL
jgi:glycerate kinase